jgi:hypothetical protein
MVANGADTDYSGTDTDRQIKTAAISPMMILAKQY